MRTYTMPKRRPPKPDPGNVPRKWEHAVPGLGTLYCLGAAFRNGERSYLIRVVLEGEAALAAGAVVNTAVATVGLDGRVRTWFTDWERRAESMPELAEAMSSASDWAVVHSVMTG